MIQVKTVDPKDQSFDTVFTGGNLNPTTNSQVRILSVLAEDPTRPNLVNKILVESTEQVAQQQRKQKAIIEVPPPPAPQVQVIVPSSSMLNPIREKKVNIDIRVTGIAERMSYDVTEIMQFGSVELAAKNNNIRADNLATTIQIQNPQHSKVVKTGQCIWQTPPGQPKKVDLHVKVQGVDQVFDFGPFPIYLGANNTQHKARELCAGECADRGWQYYPELDKFVAGAITCVDLSTERGETLRCLPLRRRPASLSFSKSEGNAVALLREH